MFQTLYVAANVRNLDMDRANEKETSSVEESHNCYSSENAHICTNCGEHHMASSKDCQFYIKEKTFRQ
jgi:hypothetical protein